jgi:hypothetical protein
VVIAMLLATDAAVILVGALDVWAGMLPEPDQRSDVRRAIREVDAAVRTTRRRIHQGGRL